MGRIAKVLNNSWVAGVGAGLIVFALTSGLVSRFDRTTLALSSLVALLAGVGVWLVSENRHLRARLREAADAPVFDAASGFCYQVDDSGHQYPLCPACASLGRKMAVQTEAFGWRCPAGDCKFFKSNGQSRSVRVIG